MGNNSPSRQRREGREAFDPNVDNPLDVQPFKLGTLGSEYKLKNWLEGWNEAAAAHIEEEQEEERVEWECTCCEEDCELTNGGTEPSNCPRESDYVTNWERI